MGIFFHSCRKWLATTSGFQQLLPQWKEDFLVERTKVDVEKIEAGTVKNSEKTLKTKANWKGDKAFFHSITILKSFKINAHTRFCSIYCTLHS